MSAFAPPLWPAARSALSPYGGAMTAERRLAELGIELPTPRTPAGDYVPAVQSGNLLYLSGAGPVRADGSVVQGKVGDTVSLDDAVAAARLTGLQLLGAMRATLGSLDRVAHVVKTFGMVNGAPGFNRTPQVIDGCSNLMVEVFGDAGRGARSAVGLAELPFDIAVEIEMIVEVARD